MLNGQAVGNKGKGTHYEDMRYAPTWREYRFDAPPALNNMALYAEDKLSMAINTKQNVELTAGVREDITSIPGSEYGTVGSSFTTTEYALYASLRTRKLGEQS